MAIGLALRLRSLSPHDEPASIPQTVPAQPAPATPENKYAPAFLEFSSNPEFAGAAVAFCLLDESGATVFASPLAATALCPASSLKTVTTAAALAILGPEFRFETVLSATAPLKADGTLEGNLILRGGGDPTFSTEDLAELASGAIARGLKSITGRILVDASLFPQNPVSDHWVWGDIGNGYGAGAFGLNLDHNRLVLRFDPPAESGGPAPLLDHAPVPSGTRWVNLVTAGPAESGDEVVAYSEPYGRSITLRGTVPAGRSGFTVSGALPDPPSLAAEFLKARLAAGGVKIKGAPSVAPGGADQKVILARHSSAPLPEIIDHLHRVSDNLETQCLFLTLGLKAEADPATAIRAHWEKNGVSFVGLRQLDGSGLARANMIRPVDLARVNFAARRGVHGQRFYQSLSAYLNGNVRAKVGSMSGVKTQVGFLRTVQGHELTYAVMANGLGPSRGFWSQLETSWKRCTRSNRKVLPTAP